MVGMGYARFYSCKTAVYRENRVRMHAGQAAVVEAVGLLIQTVPNFMARSILNRIPEYTFSGVRVGASGEGDKPLHVISRAPEAER